MHVLRRIALRAESAGQLCTLLDANTRAFDVVAVIPTSQAALVAACEHPAVTCIVIDGDGGRLPYTLPPPKLAMACERGAVFELQYCGALSDAAMRRAFFANGAAVVRAARGRGIVLSSGASAALHVRGPYDVRNLANALGLPAERAHDAVVERASLFTPDAACVA